MLRLDKIIQEEIQILIDAIIRIVPVEKIFLFGSYATGTPHADSNLDIFVVIKEDIDIREIDAMKLINKAIRDKKTMPVDVIVNKKNKFDQRKYTPSIERQIAQEGMVVYG
ncbi:nucleotidyltransferase domain-containing protein [Heliorestis convoluta]|uniref:nucleotidyltransferase domain-containing protein n=1 Tax=Heliorestis convoluta TaxID=356322 RepID=UPI001FAA8441|nr:nucleotidyltransferase domain-containing protein [Heliorestis convoluta]